MTTPGRRNVGLLLVLVAMLTLTGVAFAQRGFGGFRGFREGGFPYIAAPEQMPDADKEDALLVSITRDGKVYFGSEQIQDVDGLTQKVKDRLANKADKRVYVKADMRTRFGGVVRVVDSVRAAGVDDLGLLTDQRKTNTPPPAPPAAAGQ